MLSEDEVNRVRRQLDESEVRELMHRRARASDRNDQALAMACYHPDATEDHAGFVGSAHDYVHAGRPSTISNVWHGILSTSTEFDGDRAFSETYMWAVFTTAESGTPLEVMTAGRYLDQLVRHEGRWVILQRTVVLDWTGTSPEMLRYWDARGVTPESLKLGQASTEDLYYELRGAL